MRHPARRAFWAGPALISVLALVAPSVAQVSPSISVHPASSALAGTNCTVGLYPAFPAYDPANRLIYVPNQFSSNVSVINGTCGVVGSVALPNGSRPIAAAYDPSNKDIYVTDSALRSVYVIHNMTRLHSIRYYAFGAGTEAISWDPQAKLMLCATGHGLLVGISGTKVNGSTRIGTGISEGMVYDSRANEILATLFSSQNVTGVNATHPFLGPHLNIHVGRRPVGIAYDPVTGYDYVANDRRGHVHVINGTGSLIGGIFIGRGLTGIAVDTAKHEVFVTSSTNNTITVIKGLTVVRTLRFAPPNNYFYGVAYDPFTKLVYVTGLLNSKVFIVT